MNPNKPLNDLLRARAERAARTVERAGDDEAKDFARRLRSARTLGEVRDIIRLMSVSAKHMRAQLAKMIRERDELDVEIRRLLELQEQSGEPAPLESQHRLAALRAQLDDLNTRLEKM